MQRIKVWWKRSRRPVGRRARQAALMGLFLLAACARTSRTDSGLLPPSGLAREEAPAPLAYVTNVMSNSVSVIDTREHVVLQQIRVGQMPRGVAASPDGQAVYVANQLSDTISVIRTADNSVRATIPVDKGPYGVSVSPDGQELYIAHAGSFPESGHTVSVFSTRTRQVVGSISVQDQPTGVAVSPDGTRLYVTNMRGVSQRTNPDTGMVSSENNPPGTLSVIDTKIRQVIATVTLTEMMATGVAVSPDGQEVYVAHQIPEGIVSVIRTRDLALTTTIRVGNGPFGVAVSPDGTRLYVTNLGTAKGDETVSVIALPSHDVIATVTVGKVPVGLSVTPDGREVYVANRRSNTVSVIDTATFAVKATIGVEEEPWGFGSFIAVVPRRSP